jgi:predicted branched-subunit amino acid permease
MRSTRSEFIAGAQAVLPLLVGVIPFGMIYGVLAMGAGLPAGMAQAMSAVVFAGSAQFVTTQLVASGTPLLAIIITAVIVNLRHALYSASVAPYVQHLPARWKWLLAYLLTDEAYAVSILHYGEADEQTTEINPVETLPGRNIQIIPGNGHWFFLGAGLALWTSWQLSTAAGIFLGAQIPASWSLDFTLALTFIALMVPALKDHASAAAALAAGVTAVAAANFPLHLGLVFAALVGILIGLVVERARKGKP